MGRIRFKPRYWDQFVDDGHDTREYKLPVIHRTPRQSLFKKVEDEVIFSKIRRETLCWINIQTINGDRGLVIKYIKQKLPDVEMKHIKTFYMGEYEEHILQFSF